MSEVSFYHLQSQGLEIALPKLLETITSRGMHVLLRGVKNDDVLASMDKVLWSYSKQSFLAHAMDTDKSFAETLAEQPILLTTSDTENANRAEVLLALDTQSLSETVGFKRVLLMFDGKDPDATSEARAKWKELKNSGATLTYWQQSDAGKWEKKL